LLNNGLRKKEEKLDQKGIPKPDNYKFERDSLTTLNYQIGTTKPTATNTRKIPNWNLFTNTTNWI